MSDWTEGLEDIVFDGSFMTLATADADGAPWATPVEYACDEALRLYWFSEVGARHSVNLRSNPRAAFSMYDSRQPAGVGGVQGLYGEGHVVVLTPAEYEAAIPALRRWITWRDVDRSTPRPVIDEPIDGPDSPWRCYRLDTDAFYALGPSPDGRMVDHRTEVDLATPFGAAYRARAH